jgi:hypothetical protein
MKISRENKVVKFALKNLFKPLGAGVGVDYGGNWKRNCILSLNENDARPALRPSPPSLSSHRRQKLRSINNPFRLTASDHPLRYLRRFALSLSLSLVFFSSSARVMASLTDLVNLDLSDCTDRIIAEYIWLASL